MIVYGDENFWVRFELRDWSDRGRLWPIELRGPWTKDELDAARAWADNVMEGLFYDE